MNTPQITISGVGCCLVDRLYNQVSFNANAFRPCLSKKRGDGGLTPGQLVFKEDLEKFTGRNFEELLPELTTNRPAEKINVGGPCIVALVHAAQITTGENIVFRFYGTAGQDEDGRFLVAALKKTPVNIENYTLLQDAKTPADIVLSDPTYDNGNGERMFILTLGTALDYKPEQLDESFFDSDIVVFGATALVPSIHDHLEELLAKAKSKKCLTIVNTVFDFRNEKENPGRKWQLGKTCESYKHVDLLIADMDEALHLSGKTTAAEAMEFFAQQGTGAAIITNGAKNILLFSSGAHFSKTPACTMPVSEAVTRELKNGKTGDTTGCGDNFAGGVIASVAEQLQKKNRPLDLVEACRWGVVSGGFACFYVGGTWFEQSPGEKRQKITPYYETYKKQLAE